MIVKNNPDEFQNYLSDASNYQGAAAAVYLPESEEDIIALVRKFNTAKTRMTISGNGTGLTGSRVPEGGVVIAMEKMNKIIELNEVEKYLRVQPGMILKDIQEYVEEKKLFYPPDPTERNCFIGATVATNSSGARSFKYGPTRDYIIGMRVVLPSGDTLSIERGKIVASAYTFSFAADQGTKYQISIPQMEMPDTKNASGYYCRANMDLMDLFIGSEGTLGIITELKLKLIALDENILSCVVFFKHEEDAFNFIEEARAITRSGSSGGKIKISARGLEFFNELTLNFLREDYPAIPHNTCSVWFEQELAADEEELTAAWLQLMLKHHADAETTWLAVKKKEQEKFKDFRHAISWKVNEFVARRGLRKVGTDVAVPAETFRSFYKWMTELVEQNKIEYVVYGHFGNCHIHLNMLPKNQGDFIQAKKIYAEICCEAVRLKGTVSAEHGIGKMKREYLLMMYGEAVIRQMAKVKLVFDPNVILNIGNIFDEKYLRE
ncbi:MAG: FAD-binding oxidoreductase [Deltaproteobacteria bacterium]|nr:FAD-binding oxidoreductase [Deltaproteobacteria bacterium]